MKKVLSIAMFLTIALTASVFAEGMIEEGKKVQFEYTLTVDGQVVDSSEGKQPLEYVHGAGNIIAGLEKELLGLKVGDEKNVTVAPEEAYGVVDPNAIQEVPKDQLPPSFEPQVGVTLGMRTPDGRTMPVKIVEVKEETVMMDFNHPLAGKELMFNVKIVSIG